MKALIEKASDGKYMSYMEFNKLSELLEFMWKVKEDLILCDRSEWLIENKGAEEHDFVIIIYDDYME